MVDLSWKFQVEGKLYGFGRWRREVGGGRWEEE
jgi:hypothetical protein